MAKLIFFFQESSHHPVNFGPFERGVWGGAWDGTFEKPISEVWIHWKPEIGNWNVYPDAVKFAKHVFRENNIATYFIMPPQNRRKTHLFSTLNARNNGMMTGKFPLKNLEARIHSTSAWLNCSAPDLKRFPLFNNSTGDSYIAGARAGSTFHCYLEAASESLHQQQLHRYIIITIITLPGGGKRKPSFKMVSNMVIQLLHTIKFSMEVPFSNMTQQPVEMQKTLSTKNKVISTFHSSKKMSTLYET